MAEAEDLPGRLRARAWSPTKPNTATLLREAASEIERLTTPQSSGLEIERLNGLLELAAKAGDVTPTIDDLKAISTLLTRLQSLEVENARLLGEVEKATDALFTIDPETGRPVGWDEVAATERSYRRAAEAALALAREGLEPFARIGRAYNSDRWGHVPDDHTYAHNVSVANYRRAAQVYASIKDGGEG